MKTLAVEYDEDGVQAKIVVHRCTGLDGIRRGQMIEKAESVHDEDTSVHLARVAIMPLLVSATSECQVKFDDVELPWPFEAEQLAYVPETLLDEWMSAIYDLNPKLNPGAVADEKKG